MSKFKVGDTVVINSGIIGEGYDAWFKLQIEDVVGEIGTVESIDGASIEVLFKNKILSYCVMGGSLFIYEEFVDLFEQPEPEVDAKISFELTHDGAFDMLVHCIQKGDLEFAKEFFMQIVKK